MKSAILLKYLVVFCYIFLGSTENYTHTGLFWHLTDVHVDLDYEKHACKGLLGDQKCDSPLSLWISALNAARRLFSTTPDFVVFSGDSVSHDVTQADYWRTMEAVASSLKVVFSSQRPPQQQREKPLVSVPIIFNLGNHDVYPDNSMSVEPNDTDRRNRCTGIGSSAKLWGDWVANAPDADNEHFNDGCFYSRLVQVGETNQTLSIISLNSLLYAFRNVLSNANVTDPLLQFHWLIRKLQIARERHHQVIIVMHFPLGAPENSPVKYRHLHNAYNERLLEIFTEFADVIAFGLFGHQHTDSFRFVCSTPKGEAGPKASPLIALFHTPSLSPKNLGFGPFNPRIRIFNYSITSTSLLHLHNYHQFFVNLSNNTSDGTRPSWNLEYSATKTYSLPDLSASSLEVLLARLTTNRSLWCTYWDIEMGGPNHTSGACPQLKSTRHCRHLCTMRHLHYATLDDCLQGCGDDYVSVSAHGSTKEGKSWNTLPVVALVMTAFLVILLGVVLLANREFCRKSGRRVDRRVRGRRERGGYRRGCCLIAYHQTALNLVTRAEEQEETKALNVEVEDGVYDADASADEAVETDTESEVVDDLVRPSTTSTNQSGHDFFSVHTSVKYHC